MNSHHPRPDRPALGRLDGRYRLVEPLGRGGTSEVWRGLDERLSRPVAVKILHGRGNDWMRNEAHALARLAHPHIATVYDYGYSQHHHFLVMELVRGEPLAAALDRGPLPWSAAVRSCAQVASALAAAHARGVVHRDVTPRNIMLTAAGVKLIDFGISALAGEREATVDGELYGTPPYAAPERLHSPAVAPAVDVFALGVVLYRAVSGCLPWRAHTAEQLLAAQQNTDPADLPAVAGLPDDVGEVCMRCLARDPADRPSAPELAALLATTVPDTADLGATEPLAGVALAGVTGVLPMTVGMPATWPTAPARWRGGHRRVKRAATALAVPAAAALAWFATGIGPADPPLPAEAMAPPAAQAAFAAPSQEVSAATTAPVATPVSAGRPNPGSAPPAPHAKPAPKQKAKPSPKHSSVEGNDRK